MHLDVENLSCARGTRLVFNHVSFSLGAGHALLITGPNGSGKTSLLRVLAGFLPKAGGEISIKGGKEDTDLGEQCHYVGHLNGVKSSLTVGENLSFYATYLDGGAAIHDALDYFGLGAIEHVPAGLLSAGQKRRLGLARLMIADRPIWLLDEPSVSLDESSTRLLANLVAGFVDGGGIVIAATHISLGVDFAYTLDMAAPGRHTGEAVS